jgi:hypothetical protein
VWPDGRTDHRPDAEIGHEVIVHHIEMDEIGTGRFDCTHLLAKTSKIGREEAGRDQNWTIRGTIVRLAVIGLARWG